MKKIDSNVLQVTPFCARGEGEFSCSRVEIRGNAKKMWQQSGALQLLFLRDLWSFLWGSRNFCLVFMSSTSSNFGYLTKSLKEHRLHDCFYPLKVESLCKITSVAKIKIDLNKEKDKCIPFRTVEFG